LCYLSSFFEKCREHYKKSIKIRKVLIWELHIDKHIYE
jgi:hypothetical protein